MVGVLRRAVRPPRCLWGPGVARRPAVRHAATTISATTQSATPTECGDVLSLLLRHVERRPESVAYRALPTGAPCDAVELSYGALATSARRLARRLQGGGVTAGDRVLLFFPDSDPLAFMTAFWACLHLHAIAVPTSSPDPMRPARTVARLQAIVQDCQPTAIVTSAALLSTAAGGPTGAALAGLGATVVVVEEAAAEAAELAVGSAPAPDAAVLLQYTSGSTGTPKGIKITHQNLLANHRAIQAAFGTTPTTHMLSWLPLYHDMGLIGGALHPLYLGSSSTLIPPSRFIYRPAVWLQAISHYRIELSGGPNFAYDLCTRKVPSKDLAGVDLSCWKVAFAGAEPIHPDTLRKFAERFQPAGFQATSLYPCYGLAESTLFVTGPTRGTGATVREFSVAGLARGVAQPPDGEADARPYVCCGHGHGHNDLCIVEPTTRRLCPEGRVGEIWVSGPSVASYWSPRDDAFQGRLADAADGPRFLRTGDLGFLEDGALYITGRLKDVIIIAGVNHYPQDIERTVEGHPLVRPGCVAAVAVQEGEKEVLIVAAELDLPSTGPQQDAAVVEEVAEQIRVLVATTHGIRPHDVVLLKKSSLPKTTSGKIAQPHLWSH